MARGIDLAVRLPDSKKWLKLLLTRMAEESGMSLNLLLCSVLETWALRESHRKKQKRKRMAHDVPAGPRP